MNLHPVIVGDHDADPSVARPGASQYLRRRRSGAQSRHVARTRILHEPGRMPWPRFRRTTTSCCAASSAPIWPSCRLQRALLFAHQPLGRRFPKSIKQAARDAGAGRAVRRRRAGDVCDGVTQGQPAMEAVSCFLRRQKSRGHAIRRCRTTCFDGVCASGYADKIGRAC